MMREKRFVLVVNLVLLIIALSMGILFYIQPKFVGFAEEYANNNQINENANFEEDGMIIVLDSESSRFRGISDDIRDKIYSLGARSIKDLSELPARYVNADGSINETKAPHLHSHYKKTAFKQILYVKLLLADKNHVLEVIEAAQKLDGVYYAGPNWIEETGMFIPNDTYYFQQWALNSSSGIKTEYAWNVTRGNNTIRVGIIDSGVAADNDLIGNIQTGHDFYNDNSVTNDPLGGHGTHVAGIVGAIGNNSLGISGVAPNVMIVPLQTAYNTAGSGYHYRSERIDAINYAISLWEDEDQRISILNHSIEGFGTDIDIVAAVNNYPGLFIWSAGNNNQNTDEFSQIDNFNLPTEITFGKLKLSI